MESEANREQAAANQNMSQSLSKTETVELLQKTIQQLEAVVQSLDSNPASNLPSPQEIDTLVSTTEKLTATITLTGERRSAQAPSFHGGVPLTSQPFSEGVAPPQKPETVVIPDSATETAPVIDEPSPPKTPAKSSQSVPPRVQPKKPKQSRRSLIAIAAAAIAATAIAAWWWLSPKPVELASQPKPSETEITSAVDGTDVEEVPLAENPVVTEEPEVVTENSEVDTSEIETEIETEPEIIETEEIDIPTELESPGESQPIVIKTVEPEILLTPEQSLIAAIQTRVAEITQDYSDDLIASVEADFRQSSLSIALSDLWYQLDESRQDRLANDIFKRSRRLDFRKLALTDAAGTLVARNPVVGDRVIILQRTRDLDEAEAVEGAEAAEPGEAAEAVGSSK